ncbi:MAG: hypothetical protein Q4D37_04860 [Oscillospiraceae bacterium]|nr:hypothetical protein [Oscillospiraceae bacterium]
MIAQILQQLQTQLKPISIPVYTAYDHIAVSQKQSPFLVLNLQSYTTELPIFRAEQVQIPFSAKVTVTLLLSVEAGLEQLYAYFTECILPVLLQSCRVQTVTFSAPKTETLLQKQTMTVTCHVQGILQPDAQETEAEVE